MIRARPEIGIDDSELSPMEFSRRPCRREGKNITITYIVSNNIIEMIQGRKMMKKLRDSRPFAERHPRWNFLIGLVMCLVLLAFAFFVLYMLIKYIGIGVGIFADWLKNIASKLDAVVIVALITGTVSLIGVILSSIVAKRIDYKKSRMQYLAQKREKSYTAFIQMVYKLQKNVKEPGKYTEREMMEDMFSFSEELTLWGSKNVADKWVQFRKNGDNLETAQNSLFLLERIMNEMRNDMGVKRLKKGNLLSFFINDIESILNGGKRDGEIE